MPVKEVTDIRKKANIKITIDRTFTEFGTPVCSTVRNNITEEVDPSRKCK